MNPLLDRFGIPCGHDAQDKNGRCFNRPGSDDPDPGWMFYEDCPGKVYPEVAGCDEHRRFVCAGSGPYCPDEKHCDEGHGDTPEEACTKRRPLTQAEVEAMVLAGWDLLMAQGHRPVPNRPDATMCEFCCVVEGKYEDYDWPCKASRVLASLPERKETE